MKIVRPKRNYLPENLVINSWEDIKVYCDELAERDISTMESFKKWIYDKSEIDAVLEEDAAWRYIRMTINTKDVTLTEKYTFFVSQIQPKLAQYENTLNKKLVGSPFFAELDKIKSYHIYFRAVDTALKLYRDENVQLEAELSELSQKFGSISGAQDIEYKGEKLTMQKASSFLKENDEEVRKEVFELMSSRRAEEVDKLDKLYSELVAKRTQLAKNAGYKNVLILHLLF